MKIKNNYDNDIKICKKLNKKETDLYTCYQKTREFYYNMAVNSTNLRFNERQTKAQELNNVLQIENNALQLQNNIIQQQRNTILNQPRYYNSTTTHSGNYSYTSGYSY